jgi:hypothetical protein
MHSDQALKAVLCAAALAILCSDVAARQAANGETRPIVSALLRDLIGPTRDRFKDDRRLIVFVDSTLTRWTEKIEPCLHASAYDVARTEAGKGSWSLGLAAEFEKQNSESVDLGPRLEGFQFRDFVIGSRGNCFALGDPPLFRWPSAGRSS